MHLDPNRKVVTVARHPSQAEMLGGFTATGLWILEPEIFEFMLSCPDWENFIYQACSSGILFAHPSHAKYYNINTPADLNKIRMSLT